MAEVTKKRRKSNSAADPFVLNAADCERAERLDSERETKRLSATRFVTADARWAALTLGPARATSGEPGDAYELGVPGRARHDARGPQDPHVRAIQALHHRDPLFRWAADDVARRGEWTDEASGVLPETEAGAFLLARAAAQMIAQINLGLLVLGSAPEVRKELHRRARAMFIAATDMTPERYECAAVVSLVEMAAQRADATGNADSLVFADWIIEAIEENFPASSGRYRTAEVAYVFRVWLATSAGPIRGVQRWAAMYGMLRKAIGETMTNSADVLEKQHRAVRTLSGEEWPDIITITRTSPWYAVTFSMTSAINRLNERFDTVTLTLARDRLRKSTAGGPSGTTGATPANDAENDAAE